MRTNIVLDETLIKEALRLTHSRSKREVVHLALRELICLRRNQQMPRQTFFSTYIQTPIVLTGFKPLTRDELYDR